MKVYQYRTCNTMGCIATTPFDDALAGSLKGTDDASVMFAGLDGKPVSVPMSFKGYQQSLSAWKGAGGPAQVLVLETVVVTYEACFGGRFCRLWRVSPWRRPAARAGRAPAPAAPPEVKTVGDWAVRCFPVKSPTPATCSRSWPTKKPSQRILSFSIAYDPSLDRHLMQITVPLEVALQKGVTIQTDSYTSPVLKYRMCTRDGCFVQMVPDNAMIEALTKSSADAKVNIVADNGKSYGLQFSLKGFSAAHDDMVTQARAKAKTAPKAAQRRQALTRS